MALINCPECGNKVSDKAIVCPHCGVALRGGLFGYEYRSQAELFGLPLVHIAFGLNIMTGRPRVAKGIIAIGNISLGVVAFGGVAFGGITLGGLAIGAVSVGGAAIGVLLALGGLAIGLVAVGGCAIGYYALGGAAFGAHCLGDNVQDPQAVDFFRRFLGDWVEKLGQRR